MDEAGARRGGHEVTAVPVPGGAGAVAEGVALRLDLAGIPWSWAAGGVRVPADRATEAAALVDEAAALTGAGDGWEDALDVTDDPDLLVPFGSPLDPVLWLAAILAFFLPITLVAVPTVIGGWLWRRRHGGRSVNPQLVVALVGAVYAVASFVMLMTAIDHKYLTPWS